MWRKIAGVVVGLPLGVVSVSVMHAVQHAIYPLPEGLDMNDMDALAEHIATMPLGDFAMVWLAHASGAFVSSAVCTLIAGQRWYLGAVICGIMFTIAGGLNIAMLPHPVWFAVVDLLLYVPTALLACYLVGSLFSNQQAAAKPELGKDQIAD